MTDLKAILSLGISVKLSAREVNGLCKELTDNEKRIAELEQIVLSVGHIGVDFGYGVYEIDQATIDKARQLTNKGGAK
mgnify:CR=1 FL=1